MKTLKIKTDVATLREAEYMSLGDQFDAIYKGFKLIQQDLIDRGKSLPSETLDWISHIESIKSKFKK